MDRDVPRAAYESLHRPLNRVRARSILPGIPFGLYWIVRIARTVESCMQERAAFVGEHN